MNKFLSPSSLWQRRGLAVVRMIVGFFLIYHGWEVFDETKIKEYSEWDVFKNISSSTFMVYSGKTAELISGFLLLLGLFTRIASLIIIITFLYISLFVGHGKIWYEDQHPFLFVLLGFVFFFIGPGTWSVDRLLRKTNNKAFQNTKYSFKHFNRKSSS